jgi:hypothetical protein
MGVAPYSWPHDREWQPGIHDKRANRGMWFVLMVYTIFIIGIVLNAGPDLLSVEMLPFMLFLLVILGALIAFFIVGQTTRRDIKVEQVKYFPFKPEHLSGLVMDVLRADLIARVDMASVTVRGSDSSREHIEAIKARIDQVALQAHVGRYEDGLRKTAPDLNVFDEPSIPQKPYDPPVP